MWSQHYPRTFRGFERFVFLPRRFGETNFHVARECSKPFNICFGLPKNSVFTAPISEVIVRLKEAGITRKFFTDEMDSVAKVATKDSKTESTAEPLTLEMVQGGFLVFALMALISLGVFLVEFLGVKYCGVGSTLLEKI